MHGRTQQRLPEPHPVTGHRHQARTLGGVQVLRPQTGAQRGRHQLGEQVPVGRREQRQEPPGRPRQRPDLSEQAGLQARGERQRLAAGWLPPGLPIAGYGRRELPQSERVTGRRLQDPAPDPGPERRRDRVEQPGRLGGRQRLQVDPFHRPGQSAIGRRPGAQAGDQQDRRGAQPPGQEREHLGGQRVEPLPAVGQHEHRAVPGDGLEQAQHGQAGGQPLRALAGEPEAAEQGPAPGFGQPGRPVQDGVQQLVQAGARFGGLAPQAGAAQHQVTAPGRVPGDVIEDGRDAGPGVAGDGYRAAPAGRRVHGVPQPGELRFPADEHRHPSHVVSHRGVRAGRRVPVT
nr:hypothetical protein [Actinoplanes missouriensis]